MVFFIFSAGTQLKSCVVYIVFLTLECGQSLLVTVDYDGLLGCSGAVLASRVVVVMETLHVELQMAITIKPEVLG